MNKSLEAYDEKVRRWRLLFGSSREMNGCNSFLGKYDIEIDNTLNHIYNPDESKKKGTLDSSAPFVNRWLGDIRKYFPTSVVRVIQEDAISRLNLKELLLEPEILSSVIADVNLVATIVQLKNIIPEETKNTAREVVRKVVDELEKRLKNSTEQAVKGALARNIKNTRPKYSEINWQKTIKANLHTWQNELKTIIPEKVIGYGRKQSALKDIILCVDQSGSMASSVVYSSIFGAVLASIKSVKTHMIVFDTEVVDLTSELQDPVDLLFGTMLGGGTDIDRAIEYCESLIRRPQETILVLISDLYEGGNQESFINRVNRLVQNGVKVVALLALSDDGKPSYDKELATTLTTLGVPAFACTPDIFPDLMAACLEKKDLINWINQNDKIV